MRINAVAGYATAFFHAYANMRIYNFEGACRTLCVFNAVVLLKREVIMNIAVFFGGKSCEHNVSIVTGLQALAEFPKEHKAVPVYIDEKGIWHTGKEYADINTYKKKASAAPGKEVHLRPSSNWLYAKNGKKLVKLDCCLICNHGVNGEDGSLQGLLQLCGLPYTGSGVAASSAGMDKALMKRLFKEAGLPIVPHITVSGENYVNDSYGTVEKVKRELKFPLIVKPSNLGSSIGIGLAHDFHELFTAVRVALEWDTSVVIESALENFEEFNCAVLCGEPSEVEKPVGWKDFLTYEDKYLSKSDSVGREFPAKIDEGLRSKIRSLAVSAYNAVGADGVARVDFLYADGELYVNEINTVPGSLSSYFFEGGTEYVVRKLTERALSVFGVKKRLKYAYKPFRGEGRKK